MFVITNTAGASRQNGLSRGAQSRQRNGHLAGLARPLGSFLLKQMHPIFSYLYDPKEWKVVTFTRILSICRFSGLSKTCPLENNSSTELLNNDRGIGAISSEVKHILSTVK